MFGSSFARWLQNANVAEAVIAMRQGCTGRRGEHGMPASGKDRNVGPAGEFANTQCVARGEFQWNIAGARRYAKNLDLRRSECEQDRYSVINAGITVDNDAVFGHVVSSPDHQGHP